MSNQLSLPSVAGTSFIRADMQFRHPEIGIDSHTHTAEASSTTAQKRKRNLPGNPDPDAEVVALSPKTLMASKRFVCEVCNKGFQRDQNLQLHRRGHNLPWKLRQRTTKELKKRVYICPEPNCVHNNPARALGDLTGIKKHFCRKHGEKKWKCNRCAKRYAVQSDWKAHSKTCGTREYRCDCGTLFSRRDSFITHRAFCDALAEETVRASNGHNHNHNHNQHLLQYKSPLFSSSSGLSNATQLAFAMNMRLPPPPNYPHYLSPPSCSSAGGSASFNGQPPLSVQSIIAFANQKQKQELVEEPVIPVTKWPYHQDTTTTNTNTNTTNNNNRLLINHELIMPENSNMHPKLSPAAGVAARGFSQISQTSLNNFPNLFPSKAVYTAPADESSEDCRNPRTVPGFINPSAVTFNSGDYHEGVQLFPEGGPLAVMFGSDGHVSTRSSASMQGQLMISDNIAAGQEICWPYNNNDRFQLSNSSTTAPTLNPMQMNSRTHATSLQSSYIYNEGSSAGIIAEASQMQDHTSSSDGFLTATPPPFGLSDIFNIKSSPKPPLLENNSVAAAYMGKTASSASLYEGIIHPMSNSLHSQLARNRRSLSHTADLPSNHYSLQSMMMNEDGWKKHGLANLALFQPPTSSSSSFSSSSSSPSIPNSIAHSDQKVLTRDFLGMGRPSHAISTLNPGRTRGATFTVSEFSNINTAAAAAASSSSAAAAAAATTAFLNHELASKTSHHYQHQYRHNH